MNRSTWTLLAERGVAVMSMAALLTIIPTFGSATPPTVQPPSVFEYPMTGETPTVAIFFDEDDDYLYVVTGGTPGTVIRFRAGTQDTPLTRVSSCSLPFGVMGSSVVAAAFDTTGDRVYVYTSTSELLTIATADDDSAPECIHAERAAALPGDVVSLLCFPETHQIVALGYGSSNTAWNRFTVDESTGVASFSETGTVAVPRLKAAEAIPGRTEVLLVAPDIPGGNNAVWKIDVNQPGEKFSTFQPIGITYTQAARPSIALDMENDRALIALGESTGKGVVEIQLAPDGEPPGFVANHPVSYDPYCVAFDPTDPDGIVISANTKIGRFRNYNLAQEINFSEVSENLFDVVVDKSRAILYFIEASSPVHVRQVNLADSDTPHLSIAGNIDIASGEQLGSSVLDPENGYGYHWQSTASYYSTNSFVHKVRLGEGDTPPTLLGSAGFGTYSLLRPGGMIDSEGGKIYVARTKKEIQRVLTGGDNANPVMDSTIEIPAEQVPLRYVLRGHYGRYGLATTGGLPTTIVKFTLPLDDAPSEIVSQLELDGITSFANEGIINSKTGYAYILTSAGEMLKMEVGSTDLPPVLVNGTVVTDPRLETPVFQAMDEENNLCYLSYENADATSSDPTKGGIIRIDLGDEADAPRVTGRFRLDSVAIRRIMPASSTVLYLQERLQTNSVSGASGWSTVNLVSNGTFPVIVDSLDSTGSTTLATSEYDPSGYIYSLSAHGLFKVNVAQQTARMLEAGQSTLRKRLEQADSLIVDGVRGYLMVTQGTEIQRIKIPFSNQDAAPPVKTAFLPASCDSAALDAEGGYAYFLAGGIASNGVYSPHLCKYTLGEGLSDFTEVSRMSGWTSGAFTFYKLLIVPSTGYGFLFSSNRGAVKFRLGEGNAAPQFVSANGPGVDAPLGVIAEPTGRYAWLIADGGKLYQIDLGEGDDPMTIVETLDWPTNLSAHRPFTGKPIVFFADFDSGMGWVGYRGLDNWTQNWYLPPERRDIPGGLMAFNLAAGTGGMTDFDQFALDTWEVHPRAAMFDPLTRRTALFVDSADDFYCDTSPGFYPYECVYFTPEPSPTPEPTVTSAVEVAGISPTPEATPPPGDETKILITPTVTPSPTRLVALQPISRAIVLDMDAPGTTLTHLATTGLPQLRVTNEAVADDIGGRVYAFSDLGETELTISEVSYFDDDINRLHAVMTEREDFTEVNALRLFSPRAGGNLQFAVYSDGEPLERLWISPPVPNRTSSGWCQIEVSQGTPQHLYLPAGKYWLVWQSDVLPFALEDTKINDGAFEMSNPFGTFPETIDRSAVDLDDTQGNIQPDATDTNMRPSGYQMY